MCKPLFGEQNRRKLWCEINEPFEALNRFIFHPKKPKYSFTSTFLCNCNNFLLGLRKITKITKFSSQEAGIPSAEVRSFFIYFINNNIFNDLYLENKTFHLSFSSVFTLFPKISYGSCRQLQKLKKIRKIFRHTAKVRNNFHMSRQITSSKNVGTI